MQQATATLANTSGLHAGESLSQMMWTSWGGGLGEEVVFQSRGRRAVAVTASWRWPGHPAKAATVKTGVGHS